MATCMNAMALGRFRREKNIIACEFFLGLVPVDLIRPVSIRFKQQHILLMLQTAPSLT